MGGVYTGYFSKTHDFLICKAPMGPKFNKAVEWDIPVVNER